MQVGDLVNFPCGWEEYNYRKGVLVNIKDNPSDVREWERHKKFGSNVPGYCKDGPRKVAEVLYSGKISSCWLWHLRPITERRER
tara:strand:- start:54 stop:305 length:252 start_codon:yes stop_codon:yes gene_type:complete